MVDSINPNAIASGSLTEAVGGDETLDRSAFLKLFVAQLQNQDPLDPQDNHEFVAQLAQFSSLEQAVGMNDRLDQLSLQNRGLQNTEAVALVGKTAEVRGNIVTLDAQDFRIPLRYDLEQEAESVTVVVSDASGTAIRTLRGEQADPGSQTVYWDGTTDQGIRAPEGAYSISVSAQNSEGAAVTTNQTSQGLVEGVSFDKGFPVLHLDNGVAVPIADLLRVSPPPQPGE